MHHWWCTIFDQWKSAYLLDSLHCKEGECQFVNGFLEWSQSERKAIGDDIRTAEFGWPVGMPLCRPMKNHWDIWEIRTSLPNNKIARVLFCAHENEIILLHGFIKKTQNTKNSDIDIAKKNERFDMTKNVERGYPGQYFEDFLKE